MARLDAAELAGVKASVDLGELVRGHGVALTAQGEDLVGLCPFHSEETASFRVTPSKGLFHCFGCGESGDAISWVQKTRQVSFRNAVEMLRSHGAKVPPVERRAAVHRGRLDFLMARDVDDTAALDKVVAYYHQRLFQNAGAMEYLRERLIGDEALLKEFHVGFVDRTLGYHLPPVHNRDGKEQRTRLMRLGVLRESGHEALRGCVTFPIVDGDGHVLNMYGRRAAPPPRATTEDARKHWYLSGPRRGVFNLAGIRGQEVVILCEAVIDALTFWACGMKNVTCSWGVEGFSDDIFGAVKETCRKVYIAYDRDEAGDRAAEKLAERLRAEGMECFRVKFPKGMDANGYARKMSPAENALRLVLGAAEWMGAGEEKAAAEEEDVNDAGATAPAESTVCVAMDDAPPAPVPARVPPAAARETAAAAAMGTRSASSSGPSAAAPSSAAVEVVTHQETLATELLEAEEHHFVFGDRRYRVRGLKANTTLMVMKVNITVRAGAAFYVDTLDLLMARARAHFIRMAGVELGVDDAVVKADIGQVLEKLERVLDARLQKLLERPAEKKFQMTPEEQAEALALLKDPRMLDRIVDDLGKMGLVGERTNKLTSYLAAVSRKLFRPLAILIQSVSGAGKSSLMEAVLSLMPEEDIQKYSAMTSQALYYMGETNLRHKILALAEEEGAEKASYPLKLLQSEGELTIASTGKDPTTGRHETKEYHVEGPVMVFVTTTAPEVDEEFLNRCMVLAVDESREQTRAIHEAQRTMLTEQGIFRRGEREAVKRVHRNAQRLLKTLAVSNPYAAQLKFPDHQTRTRRDFPKYAALIESITLLHQHQREVKEVVSPLGVVTETVVTTLEDIALANALATEILGCSLDELQVKTRQLLTLVDGMVAEVAASNGMKREDVRVTQRDIRERTGWGNTQLKVHLARLVEREFLIVHRLGPGLRYGYELFYDGGGQDGRPFVNGLTPVEALKANVGGGRSAPGRGGVGGVSAPAVSRLNGREHSTNGLPASI